MCYARLAGLALTALTGFFGETSAFAQGGQLSLIDLGPGTKAYGINATGQVTGCVSIGAGATHAFLYTAGTMTDLGTLGGASSCGFALNASGQVTGYADSATDQHAFLYDSGAMVDLSAVSGVPTTAGNAINAGGDVVGAAPPPPSAAQPSSVAFLYSHGSITILSPSDLTVNTGEAAFAINDVGVIAGDRTGECGILCPTYIPFTIENGVQTLLPIPSGVFDAQVTGINAAGQIVTAGEDPGGFFHGSLYTNGIPVDLGSHTSANGINSNGDIVGNSNVARAGTADTGVGVFLYRAGATRDLNLPGVNPTGINDSGWIIANHPVLDHAYLLSPSSLGLSPTGLSFGNKSISEPSSQAKPPCGSCTVTLTNTSLAAITVGNISATESYSVTDNCTTSLAAGATCRFNVTFTPTVLGLHAGALTVNAGNTTYATLLLGVGTILMTLTSGSSPAIVGHPFTISWNAGTGAACTGSGGSWNSGFNMLPASGSQAITESVAGTYTYSLDCFYGTGGTLNTTAQLAVVVQPPQSSGGGSGGSGSGGGSVDLWMLATLAALWAARRLTPRIPVTGAVTELGHALVTKA